MLRNIALVFYYTIQIREGGQNGYHENPVPRR